MNMRIVVLSDSHGNAAVVEKLTQLQPKAGLFIHLGDGLSEFRRVMQHLPDARQKEYWCVRGNCDVSATEETTLISWVKDIKILYTHGHQWNVKNGTEELAALAKKEEARLALFGHTHFPYYYDRDGLILLNPGSIGNPKGGRYPTYATIDIQGKSIVCNQLEIKH